MPGKLRCRPGNQRIFKATMTHGAMPNACYGCRGGSCVPHFAPRLKIRMTRARNHAQLQSPRIMQRLRAAGSPAGCVLVMMRNAFADLAGRRSREVQAEEPFEEMIAAELSQEAEA